MNNDLQLPRVCRFGRRSPQSGYETPDVWGAATTNKETGTQRHIQKHRHTDNKRQTGRDRDTETHTETQTHRQADEQTSR